MPARKERVGVVFGATPPFVENTRSVNPWKETKECDLKIARNLYIHLKDGKQKEFTQLFQSQILPVLRQQAGFRDELTLLDNNRVLVIALWDDRKNVERYQSSVFPNLMDKLNPLVEFPPTAEIFEVAASTRNKAA
jgi:heme-degrading monooxygenase HmoA